MKKIILLCILMSSSLISFAQTQGIDYTEEKIQGAPQVSLESILKYKSSPSATCFAYTGCQNGNFIRCEVYGDSCTWYLVPGEYVECQGYNYNGQWVKAWATCYPEDNEY